MSENGDRLLSSGTTVTIFSSEPLPSECHFCKGNIGRDWALLTDEGGGNGRLFCSHECVAKQLRKDYSHEHT